MADITNELTDPSNSPDNTPGISVAPTSSVEGVTATVRPSVTDPHAPSGTVAVNSRLDTTTVDGLLGNLVVAAVAGTTRDFVDTVLTTGQSNGSADGDALAALVGNSPELRDPELAASFASTIADKLTAARLRALSETFAHAADSTEPKIS